MSSAAFAAHMHTTWLAAVHGVAEQQQWLVDAAQLRAIRVSPAQVSDQLRRGRWRALYRGVYLVDADMYDDLPPQLWWRAALRAHGPGARLASRTAVRALGVQGLPATDTAIELVLADGRSRARRDGKPLPGGEGDGPALVVRQLKPVTDPVLVDGLSVCPPEMALIDAALQLDRVHTLSVLDSSLHLGLLTPEVLQRAVDLAAGRRGCRQLRELAVFVDGRAESPLESRIRLCCIDGDLTPDDLQHTIRNEDGFVVARGDLAWLKRRRPLLGECDGEEPHSRPKPLFRDRRRGNALTGLAHDTVRFTWTDSLNPSYVQWVVRRALAA